MWIKNNNANNVFAYIQVGASDKSLSPVLDDSSSQINLRVLKKKTNTCKSLSYTRFNLTRESGIAL